MNALPKITLVSLCALIIACNPINAANPKFDFVEVGKVEKVDDKYNYVLVSYLNTRGMQPGVPLLISVPGERGDELVLLSVSKVYKKYVVVEIVTADSASRDILLPMLINAITPRKGMIKAGAVIKGIVSKANPNRLWLHEPPNGENTALGAPIDKPLKEISNVETVRRSQIESRATKLMEEAVKLLADEKKDYSKAIDTLGRAYETLQLANGPSSKLKEFGKTYRETKDTLARQHVESGKKLLEQGKDDEASVSFTKAIKYNGAWKPYIQELLRKHEKKEKDQQGPQENVRKK